MRRKVNLLLVSLLLGSLLFTACNNEGAHVTGESIAVDELSEDSDESPEESQEAVEEIEVEVPDFSKQVTELPWEEDESFIKAQMENDTTVLIAGFVTVSNGYTEDERENIKLAANMIAGSVLEPDEVFSQNEVAGPYTEEKGYLEGEGYVGGEVVKDFGGGVCNVATTLYNTSILSDLEIVERHNHSMPVDYVPYGQDAAVAYGYKDFQFKNSTDDTMLIWAELIDNRLYMGFYGKEAAPVITWEHDTLSETETTTEYRTNPNLEKGDENILVEGMDGKVVDSVIKIEYDDGEEIKDLGRSTYNPLKHLIEINE